MGKKVLMISPTPSHPQNAGNRARIYNLLKNLQCLGHEVHFLHIEQELGDRSQMLQAWGKKYYSLPYIQYGRRSLIQRINGRISSCFTSSSIEPRTLDDWYDDSVNKFILDLHEKNHFNVVVVEYVFFSKALDLFGDNVLKIIDTHDIFADRSKLYKHYSCDLSWFSTTKQEEAKGLSRANLVFAIQDEEKKIFESIVDKKVLTIGHTVSLKSVTTNKARNCLAYVASANNVNIHGIKYFLSEVFPKIQASIPDVKLLIAGQICDIIENHSGCIKLGRLEDVNTVYDACDLVINPTMFGTGLKIKSIEALGQGKALVTTPEGAKGLENADGKALLIARDSGEFSSKIIQVLSNPSLVQLLSEGAFEFAKNYNVEVRNNLEKALQMHSAKAIS